MDICDDHLYESNDGFSTRIWGNCLWFILHMISFNFPVKPTQQEKLDYRIFFKSLAKVLPCRVCRQNFAKQTRTMSLVHFRSRHTLARYIYRLHENVPNQKPLPVSFEEMRYNYESFRSKCGPNGCIVPNNGVLSRTVLSIEPINQKPNFRISKKCFKKNSNT